MGLRVVQDCDAGFTLAHGGGYPGYGSYVLLLPDHDIGIFAFANRTYAGPVGMVWDIAMELQKSGWLTGRVIRVSAALAQLYACAAFVETPGLTQLVQAAFLR